MFAAKQTSLETYVKNHVNMTDLNLVFENTGSDLPVDLYNEFLRLTIQFGDSRRMQIGGNGYRHYGILLMQIFTREGVGSARGVALADLVSAMLRDQIVDAVNLWVPAVAKVPFAEKGWFQVQVATPFYFDEVT